MKRASDWAIERWRPFASLGYRYVDGFMLSPDGREQVPVPETERRSAQSAIKSAKALAHLTAATDKKRVRA